MKGYTIQHSIELLEKQAGSGSGGASTAAQVSFDNTGTGLVATNVQGAITELDSKGHTYSTTEAVIGKWIDDSPVYEKVVDCGAMPNATTKATAHGISNLKDIIDFIAIAKNTTSGQVISIPMVSTTSLSGGSGISFNDTNIEITSGVDRTTFNQCYVVLRYTKTTSNTRSKKSKKEE